MIKVQGVLRMEGNRKGPWKAEEDEVLLNHVKKYGPRDWSSIRSKGLLQRTGKSCRLRWVNKLRPNLKNGCKFSAEEERVVLELQAEFGNKWAKIATYLPGRTDNDVKNFWSSRQKRLARILQASPGENPSSSNSNPKPQKDKKQVAVFQHVPMLQVQEEDLCLKQQQSVASSTYSENTKAMQMMPLPNQVKTEQPYRVDSQILFPEIQQPQGHEGHDLVFLEENQPLLEDPYFFLGQVGDISQLPPPLEPLPPLFDQGVNSTDVVRDDNSLLTPDTLFDDFPVDMFDNIEQLPSPSQW